MKVVSSSLGWSDWWTFKDFDGKTSATSVAVKEAAKRGILVVNSIGNYGTIVYYLFFAYISISSHQLMVMI